MSHWKEYKLGEIADKITKGTTPSTMGGSFLDKGINFIKAEAVTKEGTIDESKFAYIDSTTYYKLKRSQLQEGDILFSMAGVVLGKTAMVEKRHLPANTNQALALIRINPEIALPRFVKYFLGQKKVFDFVNSSTAQSAQPNINLAEIGDLKISLPPLPTQTAIASILSSLDEKIELNNAINRNLEALAQALFKQWFVEFNFPVDQHGNFSHLSGEMSEGQRGYKDSGGELVESELGMIPKGWRVGVLSDVIYFSNGYAFNSKELQSSDIGDCYHVFKMGHIKKGGGLNSNGTKSYFERSKSEKLKKYVLTIGDLLMCMTDMKGNVALLGHTALMNENDKYIVNQRVGLLRPKNDIGIDYPYLYILTNSTDFIEDLRSRANSGVQVNLSTSEIKNSRIIIPPTNINIAFNNVATPLFYNIFNSSKENDELSKLRDTLLPKLISGELEVKDINWG